MIRRNQTHCITIAAAILLIAGSLFGQPLFQAGANFTLAFPQNEFGKSVDNNGFGGTGFFVTNIPKSPLFVGASLTFLIYGSETREEPWSQTIPDVFVDVTTNNNIVAGHILFRVQPPRGAVLPYLDALLGFNYLWTETSVHDQGDVDDDDIASTKQLDDIAFSFGGGGGLMFRVYSGPGGSSLKRDLLAVYVDLGFRYLKGGEAEYLKEGSIQVDNNNQVNYDIQESTTDILSAHIGVSFAF